MPETKASDNKKTYLVYIITGILLNCFGRAIAVKTGCPALLDSLGTVFASYYGGIVTGVAGAVLSGGLCAVSKPFEAFYIIPGVTVAIAAALLTRLSKYMKRFLSAMNATLLLCLVKTVGLTAIYVAECEGRTGIAYPDAIIDYLAVFDIPMVIRCGIASLYICFADLFVAVTVLFIADREGKYYKRKRRASELKKALGKKISLVLLPALFFMPASRVNAGTNINFVQRLYNSENGMVGSCANDIVQTDDGTMWIGTYGGLYRFNGEEFVHIEDIESVRSVQSLYVDNEDRLWVGTDGAGVTVMMPDNTSRHFNSAQGLPAGTVKDIVRAKDGYYYIGTTGGLAIVSYDGEYIRIRGIRGDIGSVSDIALGTSGEIAVLSTLGDVYIFRDRSLVMEIDYKDIRATCVSYDIGGYLYVGTDSEYIYKYRIGEKDYVMTDVFVAKGLENINDVYFDESGYIFIASDLGIGYSDPEGTTNIISNDSFNNSVETIFRDYQGNLWFTSSRCGLLALSRSSFTDLFSVSNEREAVVNVTLEWKGLTYIGTDDGLRILDSSRFIGITNEVTKEFEGVRIRSMAIDENGDLIIAANGKPLMRIGGKGGISRYLTRETDDDAVGYKVRLIKSLANGNLITLGDDGICFIDDHKVSYKMKKSEELGNAVLLNAAELSDGTLLVGTDGDGIAVIKNRKLLRYITERDGLSSEVILRVVDDRRGSGTFVLTGSGLCYIQGDYHSDDISVRVLNHPPYYNNYDLYQRMNGDIFISGGAGVYVIDYDDLLSSDREVDCTLLDTKSGLSGSLTSNAWNCVVDDSYMYLCGNKGVYLLYFDDYEMEVTEYKAGIATVKFDGETMDLTGSPGTNEIRIPLGTKKLELTLEINNFTIYDPYVRYYFAGMDDEKITVKSSELESITYYNIPHGNNEFHMELIDDDGKVLMEKSYTMVKDREIYETTAFQVYFYVVLILIVLYGVNSVINGGVYEVTRKLKSEHARTVNALEREKKEAVERSLYIEEEAGRARRSFMDKMSSEIQTPVNTIAGMNTMIMREAGQQEIRDYARDIGGALHSLKTVIAGMLDYDTGFDKDDEQADDERFYTRDARILVADSIELNLSVAMQLLKRIRIDVDTATSGLETVSRAMSVRYDIIMIDSMMPEMSGEEVLKKIHDDCPLNSGTPVIVTSTIATRGARQEYLRLGFSNYLVKPIDPRRLEAMVESYLPEKKIVYINEGERCILRSSGAVSPELLEELEKLDKELGEILKSS